MLRIVFALLISTLTLPLGADQARGVVVEETSAGFAAAEAGLQPGDVLLRWERAANQAANLRAVSGEIEHPFDLSFVEVEQAPRGQVTLFGERLGEPISVALTDEEWRLRARPRIAPEELTAYETAGEWAESEEQGAALKAIAAWVELAEGWSAQRPGWASWLFSRVAELEQRSQGVLAADGSFERALRESEKTKRNRWTAELYRLWAWSLKSASEWDRMESLYNTALELVDAESLAGAAILNQLGLVELSRRDLAAAESYYQRALVIRERLAPGSLAAGTTLGNLGAVAWSRDDLRTAGDLFQRALAIQLERGSQGLAVAISLNNLAAAAAALGDLAVAQDYLLRSLSIRQELAPESADVAMSLANLGTVAADRGDRAEAESYYRRSLSIYEELESESLNVAIVLDGLGTLVADPAMAQTYHQRALTIQEELAPGSLDVARSLLNLGITARDRGDLTAAEEYLTESLAVAEKVAPEGIDVTRALLNLGVLAHRRHDFGTADNLLRKALALRSAVAPNTALEAEILHQLAQVQSDLERPTEALQLLRRNLTVLESQAEALGGDRETRGSFLARYGAHYRATIQLLIQEAGTVEAFHVLERSRVRGLLAMLAERPLLFSELPEDLRQERLATNAEHDRILHELGTWTALRDDSDQRKTELRRRLDTARLRQKEVQAKIRAASPRFAALQYPEPLTLEQTRGVLDPGTLLLAYSIGEKKSYVFLVGSGQHDFAVIPLEITLQEARELVERFRQMWTPGSRRNAWIRLQAEELGNRLLVPAAAHIAAAERLVFLPDGPLHYLSFAALKDPGSGDRFRYIIESKPVSVVASATLFGQIKQQRRRKTEVRIAAFGDPDYRGAVSEELSQEPVLRTVVRGGFELLPLPGTRAEVAALHQLYPEATELFLGADAREEAAKSVGTAATILHFATHGLVDDREPLSSALALSIPREWAAGQDNGLLQAWEIFEQVRLDADLVTLSACDTALGRESAGEGLLGLTRAFQYAGARSILASLWAVSDQSTAVLMEHFYRHLSSGSSKDQALRSAQLGLLAGPIETGRESGEERERDYTHPFFWAPFQIIGDWK